MRGSQSFGLWTFPYSSDLQPIEIFWVAGKNHAAMKSYSSIKMKETIKHVHEGWYGNQHLFPDHDPNDDLPFLFDDYETQIKRPVDCMKLFNTSVR